jgi:hypothetical protein
MCAKGFAILVCFFAALPGNAYCVHTGTFDAKISYQQLEKLDLEVRRAFHEISTLTKKINGDGEINGFALHDHSPSK